MEPMDLVQRVVRRVQREPEGRRPTAAKLVARNLCRTAAQQAAEFVSRLTHGAHVGAVIHEHFICLRA